ncbi:hypothetical protein BDA99DRAFT_161519 [Phascolomyces articulosus]|uniref:Uncharacterized protein n=1 Tax=Phascolomyces articulosus TaxID=60185 RepID=A0AAD5JUM4_9FUNG|nr:hypothetical protein BDA99DRAFT_161519 [Phascolomyces articulosus]
MINKRDVTEYECSNWGNQYPVCEPTSKDTWYQGSDYKFIWNYNNPYYIINTPVENNSLDFHLYHLENFAYKHIREWNNLPLLTGSLEVNVNNTWFPKPAPENKNETWQMFGWFLPAGSNATQMLTATDSTYPRPFNWSVVRKYIYRFIHLFRFIEMKRERERWTNIYV